LQLAVQRKAYQGDPLIHERPNLTLPRCNATAPYAQPLLPALHARILSSSGKDWRGVSGVARRLPGEHQYTALLKEARGMLYLGAGQLTTYVNPQVRVAGW